MEPPRISVILLVTIAISSTTSGYDSIFGKWSLQQHQPGSCTNEGSFPVYGDCTKYYKCVKNGAGFMKQYFTCKEGTIWDTICNACFHASIVIRDDCNQENDSTNWHGHQTPAPEPEWPGQWPDLVPSGEPGQHPGQHPIPQHGLIPGSCKSQEFFPVHGDCSRYYTWVNNGAGLTKCYFSCVPGTIWDPVCYACLHPSVVNRDECKQINDSTNWHGHQTPVVPGLEPCKQPGHQPGQKPGSCNTQVFLPVDGDCSRYYIWVNNGAGLTKFYFTCVLYTIWDPVSNACLHPSEVNRNDCSQVEHGHQTTVPGQWPGQVKCGQTGPKPGQHPIQLPGQIPGSCISEGFFPIRGDCTKYYKCVKNGAGFTKYYFSCEPGTIWDPVCNSCLHPSVVNRHDCSQVPSQQPGKWPALLPSEHPGQQAGQIPDFCTREGYFPIKDDCTKYFSCVNNGEGFTKYYFSCERDTIWDPLFNACLHPSVFNRHDCSHVPSEKPGQQPGKWPALLPSEHPGQHPGQIPGTCTREGYFPIIGDCTKYYKCEKNGAGFTMHDFSCERGTIWDPDTQVCYLSWFVNRSDCSQVNDSANGHGHQIITPEQWPGQWQGQVQCKHTGPQPGQYPIQLPGHIPGSCASEGFFPIRGDCTKYYKCVKNGAGFTKYYFSCAPGTIWDPVCNSCLHPSVVNRHDCSHVPSEHPGQQPGQMPDFCIREGYFPIKGDCSKYYRCVKNGAGFTKYYFSCTPGTIWDIVCNACLHPSAFNRHDCNQVEVPSDKPGQQPGKWPALLPSELPGSCTREGYFPIRGDCTKYYKCVKNGAGFKKKTFNCKDDTIWDPACNACLHASIVIRDDCSHVPSEKQGHQPGKWPVILPSEHPGQQPGQIPGSCTREGYFPVQGDCTRYYRCENNDAGFAMHIFSCEDGKIWDPDTQVCYISWVIKRPDCNKLIVQPTQRPSRTRPILW